ncbi:MAG: DegT/DnrJ/EryC1/StrS family aminotransferase [Candidatus Pacebacteria bacterium]|jgi:dTDP-4-amino-4,6-dideoxygalactose transaminase|nr:DegT/DnrJ/EryC1/StrS family aminotransferase [Candidatus Paceibacterota bacterium]
MEFFDLKKQYQSIKEEIDGAVLRTLENGVFIGGPEVAAFEKEAAVFLETAHAITLNSGTDALYLALKALDIGPGDEVLVPDFTFIATAETVAQCGAVPVFVDIDPVTFNIDPEDIEKKITSRTKAIIPVHLFGRAADMTAISKIAKDGNLYVIEDAAQAMGAKCGQKFCGTVGDIGCFSFFPTKNLGAYGDGGMLTTDNDDIAQKIKLLRAHGSSPTNKYLHLTLGVNSRLDAIQAAVLRVKLRHLNDCNDLRIGIAEKYNESLAGAGDMIFPGIGSGRECVFHQYTITTDRRDALQKFLKERQIPTMVYYSVPLHSQPAFEYLGIEAGSCPNAALISQKVISLPIYPEFSADEQEIALKTIKEFYGG